MNLDVVGRGPANSIFSLDHGVSAFDNEFDFIEGDFAARAQPLQFLTVFSMSLSTRDQNA